MLHEELYERKEEAAMRRFVMVLVWLVFGAGFLVSFEEPIGGVIVYPVGIVDGDTLDVGCYGRLVHSTGEVDMHGELLRVRLIGVDAPERGERGFSEAKEFLRREVFDGVRAGKILVMSVGIKDGRPVRDKYGRVLGVLSWSEDKTFAESVNTRIILRGLGTPLDIRGERGVNYLTRKVHGGVR